jgi:hypothetical protein
MGKFGPTQRVVGQPSRHYCEIRRWLRTSDSYHALGGEGTEEHCICFFFSLSCLIKNRWCKLIVIVFDKQYVSCTVNSSYYNTL